MYLFPRGLKFRIRLDDFSDAGFFKYLIPSDVGIGFQLEKGPFFKSTTTCYGAN
jgi:hypothetical protein